MDSNDSITAPNTLATLRHELSAELALLNSHIAQALESQNVLVNKIIHDYLTSKGKQIRPIMVMLAARLFGGPEAGRDPRVANAAAAVEMLHNASLIHDDVVDQSNLRRGLPTVNAVWDNHVAVLIGDFFVSSSLAEALATEDLRIIAAISALGRMLSVGEMDQIYNARFHQLTEESYYQVIGRKTASLFVACVEMGAYSVGIPSDDPRLEAIRRFAERLGLCFQIRDDIFDYYPENGSDVGKPTGNDLREGKITLPLLHALMQTQNPEQPAMLELSRKEELTPDDIVTLIEYAKRAGGIDYAYASMERLRDEAIEALSVFTPCADTERLASLCDFIVRRRF